MKSFIISLAIAALIVAGSVAYGIHMQTVSEELISINDRLSQAVEEENYESASYMTEKIEDYLNSKRTLLAAIDNHEVLDKIEMNLEELSSFIEGAQKTDALSKCRVLGFLYEHLPKNYELKFENIL